MPGKEPEDLPISNADYYGSPRPIRHPTLKERYSNQDEYAPPTTPEMRKKRAWEQDQGK